jgi:hypothetical protein
MQIEINDEVYSNIRNVTVIVGNSRFRISVDKFNELIINKSDGDDGSMKIHPRVSNEISLS